MGTHRSWRVASGVALVCLVVGVICVGVGFFMKSSPVVILNHGSLTEYFERLRMNWDILVQMVRGWF